MADRLKQTNLNRNHSMLREIFFQPEVVRKIVKKYINLENGKLEFKKQAEKLKKIEKISKIILIGCGTSFHAAMIGNYMIEELVGLDCEAELADEFKNRKAVIRRNTAVIALSQSGETADTIDAVRQAKTKNAFIISVTNNIGSSLAKISDVAVYSEAGKEFAIAATKTFISQLVMLAILTVFIGRLKGMSFEASNYITKELGLLSEEMEKILHLSEDIKTIAEEYRQIKELVILGEKYNYPIALEGALKLKETAYIHAEGMATGEIEHGPMAMIDKKFLSIFIMPADSVFEKNIRVMQKIKKAGCKVVAITTEGNKKLDNLADNIIYIPKTLDVLNPVLSAIPLQLLAYYLAISKGIKISQPRNIVKVVK